MWDQVPQQALPRPEEIQTRRFGGWGGLGFRVPNNWDAKLSACKSAQLKINDHHSKNQSQYSGFRVLGCRFWCAGLGFRDKPCLNKQPLKCSI